MPRSDAQGEAMSPPDSAEIIENSAIRQEPEAGAEEAPLPQIGDALPVNPAHMEEIIENTAVRPEPVAEEAGAAAAHEDAAETDVEATVTPVPEEGVIQENTAGNLPDAQALKKDADEARANPEPDTAKVNEAINTEEEVKVNKGPLQPGEGAKDFMIVTSHPLATQAGRDILEGGGTAADAAFAAQLVLGLVEPQSSGLGGGGFALYWDKENEKLVSLDGRETAPAGVGEDLFMDKSGAPIPFDKAVVGGRAVGVPGMPKLLDELHKRFGRMKRETIFSPAEELSEYGFIVSDRLVSMVKEYQEDLRFFKAAKDYFTPGGKPLSANTNLQNPEYYRTLRLYEEKGADAIYKGEIADEIVKTVQGAWHNPGKLSLSDMAGYEVKLREPVCGIYRAYKICSMGEPSSGGLTLIQILGMLERFHLEKLKPDSALPWHLISEASRLGFADRNMYMADADFVNTPGHELINPAYIAVRSSLIQEDAIMKQIDAGHPPNWELGDQATDKSQETPGTSHIVAVDRYGNAISMTSSIESAFGAKMMSNGFLLNNQLTDFSFVPDEGGKKIANRVQAGKRPRSSMSPVIVFDVKDRPVLLIGSAGGSRIIGYVLVRLVALLDWQMKVDQALAMPNVADRDGILEIEQDRKLPFDKTLLETMGYTIRPTMMNSGLTAMVYRDGMWYGAADPRREGVAMGQ